MSPALATRAAYLLLALVGGAAKPRNLTFAAFAISRRATSMFPFRRRRGVFFTGRDGRLSDGSERNRTRL